jgi:transposase
MKEISRVGIDISRSVFQLHAADKDGGVVWRKRVHRSELRELLSSIPACEIGMEACAGAHHWGREFEAMGHTVRLLPPQYVKPFVRRNKNDAADAEAIVEAMSRPMMRFVAVKSVGQQEMGQLHRAREVLVRQRTALINEIKGFAHEFGVVLCCSHGKLRGEYLEKLERIGDSLGESTKRLMERLFEQLKYVGQEIDKHEAEIAALHRVNEVSQRLESVPGVGLLTATAIEAAVGDPHRFKNGREFAASLGLTPKQHSSGQMERLGKMSKRGDPYIRKLLIQGGHAVVMHAHRLQGKRGEWLRDLIKRRGRNKAVVAVANKNARIIWALMARGGKYASGYGEKNLHRAAA